MGLLPIWAGNMVTKDKAEVLNAFFPSVFRNNRPHILEGKGGARKMHLWWKRNKSGQTAHTHKSMGPDQMPHDFCASWQVTF